MVQIWARNSPRVFAAICVLLAHRGVRIIGVTAIAVTGSRQRIRIRFDVVGSTSPHLIRERLERIVDVYEVEPLDAPDANRPGPIAQSL